jgi:hypothetical protein
MITTAWSILLRFKHKKNAIAPPWVSYRKNLLTKKKNISEEKISNR